MNGKLKDKLVKAKWYIVAVIALIAASVTMWYFRKQLKSALFSAGALLPGKVAQMVLSSDSFSDGATVAFVARGFDPLKKLEILTSSAALKNTVVIQTDTISVLGTVAGSFKLGTDSSKPDTITVYALQDGTIAAASTPPIIPPGSKIASASFTWK